MLDLVATLGKGYATAEDAVRPLKEARSRLVRLKGDIVIPSSKLLYHLGRPYMDVWLTLSVEETKGTYQILARLDRLPKIYVVPITVGWALLMAFLVSTVFYLSGASAGFNALGRAGILTVKLYVLSLFYIFIAGWIATSTALRELRKLYPTCAIDTYSV